MTCAELYSSSSSGLVIEGSESRPSYKAATFVLDYPILQSVHSHSSSLTKNLYRRGAIINILLERRSRLHGILHCPA